MLGIAWRADWLDWTLNASVWGDGWQHFEDRWQHWTAFDKWLFEQVYNFNLEMGLSHGEELHRLAYQHVTYGVVGVLLGWVLMATAAAIPAVVRRRRRRRGCCVACGYPTRGLGSPTCPECGEAIAGAR